MADNAFVKIGTALLKHQVKKLVGEEAMGAIGAELADIGGDKLDAWLGDKTTIAKIEKAATTARDTFRGKVNDDEVEQWMVMLPIHDLPAVLSAIEELPTSSDETKLESALRETIALNWKRFSSAQVNNAVNAFLSSLRSALLPIEKQTLMVIGRSVLRTEDKVERLLKLVENLQANRQQVAEKSKGQLNTGWFFGHQYGDLETFTGRDEERNLLTDWINDKKDNLLIIRALGGFGKTSVAWEWVNKDVDLQKWHTAIWWSFYEKESGFENFLAETLKHLGIETIDSSSRQQVNDLLEAMQQTNILIIMDGFERLLRQYAGMDAIYKGGDEDEKEMENIDPSQRDCVSLVVENFLKGLSSQKLQSKVLMTTRLTPRILENKNQKLLKRCREEPLDVFKPEDAIKYFQNEGIKKATRAEILEISTRYGFHPLSLSLLVGLINENHENKGDIIVAKQLDIFDDIKANRFHVLERAFESLTLERKELLSKLSCFRGSIEYSTVKKLFSSPDLDKSLIDLRKRGLLKYTNETNRYDMHPIVRHYVYDRFTDKDRRNTHFELAMHFVDAMPVTNKNVKTLEDLAPVIELYHHMVRAGNLDEACDLLFERLVPNPLHFQFGAYQLMIELERALFLDGEDKPPRLKKEDDQAWTLNALASSYSLSGQPRRAVPLFEMHNALQEKAGNKKNLARGLSNIAGIAQIQIGALRDSENNQRRHIDLLREIADEGGEGTGLYELGRVLTYCGKWIESDEKFNEGEKIKKSAQHAAALGIISSYRALRALQMARSQNSSSTIEMAIKFSQQAIVFADEWARTNYPLQREYVRAHWLLGAAHCANNDLTLAEENLSKALNLCRQINMVDHEANILLDLARLRYSQRDFKDAQEKASEALMITERSGYVLQGADVNLFLAQYALEQEQDKAKAKEYAEEALKLATCDGPPYYYKVAYEEAERMLEKLNKMK